MSDIVIRAEGLGKRYLIGHRSAESERYTTMRDAIGRAAKGLLRSAGDIVRGRQLVIGDELEEFWALQEVSFEIKRGEVVGIIGRNGAGKSTLLKILSRITEPSAGRVEIKGRVASLLEVGTGFHPELTGRENIYLNGAILGMTRAEIKRKFDEIVEFAGVEKFLDSPVKRFSTGMYVRLAFAVAAHLEPEILVVDEVLAVGDAEFQSKCIGKMQDVAGLGRTVLFVSHNMAAVQHLCDTGILLSSGRVTERGGIAGALQAYQRRQVESSVEAALQPPSKIGGPKISGFAAHQHLQSAEPHLELSVSFDENVGRKPLRLLIGVYDSSGRKIMMLDGDRLLTKVTDFPISGCFRVDLTPAVALVPGIYTVNLALFDECDMAHYLKEAATFPIEAFDFFGTGATADLSAPILVRQKWQVL
jgi:lipopolysaccharide transport system ATP-binding protein